MPTNCSHEPKNHSGMCDACCCEQIRTGELATIAENATVRMQTNDPTPAERAEKAEADLGGKYLDAAMLHTTQEAIALRKRVAELERALKAIDEYEPKYFDWPAEEWAKHTPETCPECKLWRERKHPLQHSCDGWYRLYYEREKRNRDTHASSGYECKKIARAALSSAPPIADKAREREAVIAGLLDIAESAYRCPEWLQFYRDETRDLALEAARKAEVPNGE
jgi:hypothetical protein